jgi:stage II sporulation protein D
MRSSLAALALALALALVAAATAPAASVFVVTGRGWGHGVGLSQCGAYGFAQKGWAYDRILAHYYRGTTLGQAPVSTVRVLLAEGAGSVTVSSDARFGIETGDGRAFQLEPGAVTLGPDLRLAVGGKERKLAAPLRFVPGKSPLGIGEERYRGVVAVHVSGGKVWAVNEVGLEEYLYGVVAREMEADWAPEALKAQAVAARSYALAGLRSRETFDLYADTRSQVYGGIASEDRRTNAAVDATAGQVVLAGGKVAQTFFFASSGGRTASAVDVWGGELPYLVSVEDPYDSVCPQHRWGPVAMTAAKLRSRLGLGLRGLRDAVADRDGSGRVRELRLAGGSSDTVLRGADVRSRLELRSTWFSIGVLTLDPVRSRLARRKAVVLTGVARGLGKVALQQQSDAVWQTVAPVRPGKDGTFAIKLSRAAPGLYRLAARGVASPAIRLAGA